METAELISLVVAVVSVLASAGVSVFTLLHFNNKGDIYEIKKNAILRSLRLIDDYISSFEWKGKKDNYISKKNLTVEYLTVEARECYNELMLTVKDPNLIFAFSRIVFSDHYSGDGLFDSAQMQEYRLLCRKELGMQRIELKGEITFLNRVGSDSDKHGGA